MSLNSSSVKMESLSTDINQDKSLYIDRLKDNISREVNEAIKQINGKIGDVSSEFNTMSNNFKNAYYQLTFYLECKL